MYLVIESCDRNVTCVRPAKDLKSAEDVANGLLETHCSNIGYPEAYTRENGVGCDFADEVHPADRNDSEWNAWCNVKGFQYDVHITDIDAGHVHEALALLLQGLCKETMDTDDSHCENEQCEECPISRVLEMIECMSPEKGGDNE